MNQIEIKDSIGENINFNKNPNRVYNNLLSQASPDDLIITHVDGGTGFPETMDSGGLCSEAASFPSNPDYLPIARDIYLDTPGKYFIVVEGYNESNLGDFSIVIGMMAHFVEYPLEDPHHWG